MAWSDDYYFVKEYLDFEGKNGQDFKKSILDIHGACTGLGYKISRITKTSTTLRVLSNLN